MDIFVLGYPHPVKELEIVATDQLVCLHKLTSINIVNQVHHGGKAVLCTCQNFGDSLQLSDGKNIRVLRFAR